MPRAKSAARRGKASPKGKGRGRGKKTDDEVLEEETQETEEDADDMETSQQQDDNDAELLQDDVKQEDDSEDQEDTAEEDLDTSGGGQKRKADEAINGDDDDDDEDESDTKRAKTEADPNRPVTMFCGNLDPDLNPDTLRGFFEMNGIDVTNPRKIGYKRFGYVDVHPKDVDGAIELTGKILNGEAINVEKSKPRTQEAQGGGRVQGGDAKTLFVKGFKDSVTEDDLKNFFQDPDEGVTVTEIRLPKNKGGSAKGFGYVVFETNDALEKVMKEKQDAEMDGEKLFLDYTDEKSKFSGRGEEKEFGPSKVLFVRNLSFQVSEEELKELFKGCEAARIPPNDFGQSKGFGFVEFKTVEDAEAARSDNDGLEINGRVVQLAFANDKPAGSGGGGGPRFGGGGGGGGFRSGGQGWGGGGFGGRGGRGGGGYGGGWGGRGGRGGGGYGRGGGGGYGGGGRGGFRRGGGGGGGGWGRGGGGGGFRRKW